VWALDFLHQSRLALGLTLSPEQWVQSVLKGCKMPEAVRHDLFYGDILGAGVL
jgi:hypothetical protein